MGVPVWCHPVAALMLKSLRSPDAITPSRNLVPVQSPRNFVKLEPLGAHSLILQSTSCSCSSGHQQPPPSASTSAELIPVWRGTEPDPPAPAWRSASLVRSGSIFPKLRVVGEVHQHHSSCSE